MLYIFNIYSTHITRSQWKCNNGAVDFAGREWQPPWNACEKRLYS